MGGKTAIIVGASGGIGRALVRELADDPDFASIHAWSREPASFDSHKVRTARFDPLDPGSSDALRDTQAPIHRLIITTGMLHDTLQGPEKSWRDLDAERLARSFAINAIAPMIVIKSLVPLLPRNERAEMVALSARVGSISDNRSGGWHGYRASKAALCQLIRTLAIELARTHPHLLCVALHPGTVDTAMSKPFQSGVAPEKLFTPEFSARAMLAVLGRLSPADSGRHFAWDGSEIPA